MATALQQHRTANEAITDERKHVYWLHFDAGGAAVAVAVAMAVAGVVVGVAPVVTAAPEGRVPVPPLVLLTLPPVGTDDVNVLDEEVAVAAKFDEDDDGGKIGVTKIDGCVGSGYVPVDSDDDAVDTDADADDDGKTTGVTMMDDECGA